MDSVEFGEQNKTMKYRIQKNITPAMFLFADEGDENNYDHPVKNRFRKWLARYASKGGSYWELTGSGKSYDEVRKDPNVRIRTIDSLKNMRNKTKAIKKLMKNKDFKRITVKAFTKSGKEVFYVLFADYCGQVGKNPDKGILGDLKHIHKIMEAKCIFAITIMAQRENLFKKGASREKIDKQTEKLITQAITKNCNIKLKKLKDFKYNSTPKHKHRKILTAMKMRVIAYQAQKI